MHSPKMKKIHPLRLLLATLLRKCVLKHTFLESTHCDVTMGTDTSPRIMTTPPARCLFMAAFFCPTSKHVEDTTSVLAGS